jgi:hypothetical protein
MAGPGGEWRCLAKAELRLARRSKGKARQGRDCNAQFFHQKQPNQKIMKIRITLTEEMLGTKAANKDVFADFIASKAPDGDTRKQELDTAEHREEAGTTVFHRDPATGNPILWDYQVKGFLKEAANIMRQTYEEGEAEEGAKKKRNPWGSAKSKFDNMVFVFPRIISMGSFAKLDVCERPLRAETMQGPRVSLARSEIIPAGTSFDVEIRLLPGSPVTEKMVKQCLDYGALKGIGQWRNSGKGRFTWEEVA